MSCHSCKEEIPTWNPTMFYEQAGTEKATCNYCLAEMFAGLLKTRDARIAALEAEVARLQSQLERAIEQDYCTICAAMLSKGGE